MSSLLMLSPAPVIDLPGGEVVLDVKFVEGMKLHCQLWPGSVRCVLWRGHRQIDDPVRYAAARLGFELLILERNAPVPDLLLDESALVYCAADDMQHLDLPRAMLGRYGRLVYTVEQALPGRLGAALALDGPLRRRLGAVLWNLRHERGLRRALAEADGVHCNGYPAHRAYRRLNPRTLRYLDNRIRAPMIARGTDQEARADRMLAGEPLRLAWFGVMTPESGVADLLPLAHLLVQRGLAFRLDVYGTGPVEPRLRDGIAALGLDGLVTLHGQTGFEARLVPALRREADLFLSTRRLPTPLSAYVEALGCGLPVLGYDNAQLRALVRDSAAGWTVHRGSIGALVRAVERLDRDRRGLVAASARAVAFARGSSFETVFASRMTDLRAIAGIESE